MNDVPVSVIVSHWKRHVKDIWAARPPGDDPAFSFWIHADPALYLPLETELGEWAEAEGIKVLCGVAMKAEEMRPAIIVGAGFGDMRPETPIARLAIFHAVLEQYGYKVSLRTKEEKQ